MTVGRFERVIGIPEEEYQLLRAKHLLKDPLENKFESLSNEYDRQTLMKDPQKRVMHQGETLNEMMKVKEDLSRRIIDATPRPYQKRADSLLNFLKNKITMNDKGELVKDDGSIMTGTNVGDLIQHAVRDRRRNLTPFGWSYFLDILRNQNAPRMILNYDTLDELQKFGRSVSPIKAAKTARLSKIPIRDTTVKSIKTVKTEAKDDYFSDASRRKSRSRSRHDDEPSTKRRLRAPAKYKDYVTSGVSSKKYI